MIRIVRFLSISLLLSLSVVFNPVFAQTPAPPQTNERPAPPTRDPNTPGYVVAKALADETNPPANVDGDFIIGPNYVVAPEMPDAPKGTVIEFTMNSSDSKIYPGIAREPHTFGTVDPNDPAKLIVTTSHPAPYTRKVAVYVPAQYKPGTVAPFIVGADGPDRILFSVLDTLIAQHKIPAILPSRSATEAVTRRVVSAVSSTTPCLECMRNLWRKKYYRWSKVRRTLNSQKTLRVGRPWAAVQADRVL